MDETYCWTVEGETWHIPAEWVVPMTDADAAEFVCSYELRPLTQPDHVVEAAQ